MYTLRAAGPNLGRPITWMYIPEEHTSSTQGSALDVKSVLPQGAQLCKWLGEELAPALSTGRQRGVAAPLPGASVLPHLSPPPQRPSPLPASGLASGGNVRRAREASPPLSGYEPASVRQAREAWEAEQRRRESNRTPPGLAQRLLQEIHQMGQQARDRSSRSRSR
jgi:hypothetical protein